MAGAIGYVAGLSIRNSQFTLTGVSIGVHGQTCSNVTVESCWWTGGSTTTMVMWEATGAQNCSAKGLFIDNAGTAIHDSGGLGNEPPLLAGTIASASTITPVGVISKVSGTTTISTINTASLLNWWDGSSALEITLIFLSACSVTTGGGGTTGILRAVTYAANQPAKFIYLPGFGWYPY